MGTVISVKDSPIALKISNTQPSSPLFGSLTRQRVQQTDLCFLSPPTQKAKSRYHNIDVLISWAIKMISCEEKQDFSAIDNTYVLDRETYRSLSQIVSKSTIEILKKVNSKIYENLDEFSQDMSNILPVKIWQIHQQNICQAASLGRRQNEHARQCPPSPFNA